MGISHIEKFSEQSSSPPHSSFPQIISGNPSPLPPWYKVSPRPQPSSPSDAFCLVVCKSSMCFQSWALMNIYGIIHAAVKHTMAPFCIVKRSEILCTEGQHQCLVSLVAIKKMCAVKFSGVGLQGLIHKAQKPLRKDFCFRHSVSHFVPRKR